MKYMTDNIDELYLRYLNLYIYIYININYITFKSYHSLG